MLELHAAILKSSVTLTRINSEVVILTLCDIEAVNIPVEVARVLENALCRGVKCGDGEME